MGSSISNNSQNVSVKNDYKNRNYGSTIGNFSSNQVSSFSSYNQMVATEEYDLSSPKVINKKDFLLEKSEKTEQLETIISYLKETQEKLETEKDELVNKGKRFDDSANRNKYPGLFVKENTKGRKTYLTPKEAIKSDEYFKKYLRDHKYPTDVNKMTSEKYKSLKEEYEKYINTTYAKKYNMLFLQEVGMTYDEYIAKVTQLNSDILTIKSSKYEFIQQAKEQPYIDLMETEEFKNYIENNKDNKDSKLYYMLNYDKKVNAAVDNDLRYEYFTEQDKMIYSYLYDTYGNDEAKKYIKAIEDKLNKIEGLAKAEKFLDTLRDENGNITPDVGKEILSGGKGFIDGVLTFSEGLDNLSNSEGMMSATQYEQMYILNELTNSSGNYVNKLATQISETKGEEAAQDFMSKIYADNKIDLEYAKSVLSEQEYNNLTIKIETDKFSLLDNAYELGTSAGNMTPSMILSIELSLLGTPVFGSVVGSTLMGFSVGGNSLNQALIQGNDRFTSTVYAIFSGVSETTLGLLLGDIPGLNVGASISLKAILKEGFEELLQEFVDAGLRAVILNEPIDLNDVSKDALKSFLYGVLMAATMNGGKLAIDVATHNGNIRINSIQEALAFLEAIQKYDDPVLIANEMTRIMQENSQNNVNNNSSTISNVSSTNVETGTDSVLSTGLDINDQIIKANNNTEKGYFTSIEVTDISMMTDEVLSNIKNIDNVIFKLQDGSCVDVGSLLKMRDSAKIDSNLSNIVNEMNSATLNDIETQIAKANMYTEKGHFASIEVTDISMMTDEVLSSIKNIDNVRFRLQDGSEIDVNSLIQKRDSSKTRSTLKTKSPTFAPEVQTLFYENTIEENILEVIKRHDDKYGPGHALKQLRAFFDIKNEKYMDYNLITKSGGAREILLMYTPQQIAHALENLNYINSSVYVSGYFSRFGNSKDANYGCDQGGIESLCTYTYNGRKYTYGQAMDICNRALNSGRPLPHFKKEATPEYFFLKNKLVSQGFSSSDASIIMSTINDAGACSYAATVNEIFRAFAGKEVEFQQKFGYSMYKIENGKRKLNFNELLLDLYVHANKAENGGGFILADNRLNPYLLNKDRHDVFGRTMLDAEQQVYLSSSLKGKNESVIAKFLIPKGIDWYRSFKIASNYNKIIGHNDFSNILNNVFSEMSKGHSVSLDIFKGSGVINMKSTNEGLYSSVSTNTWSEGEGHSVFVTGIGSNGFYVSSWGREYLIPFADLQNGGYFTINCSVIGFS